MKATASALVILMAASCESSPGNEATEKVSDELVISNTKVGMGGPGGTIFNGQVFLTYTGTDEHINIMRQSGSSFIKQTLGETTHVGSSLAVFGGVLYLAWVGTDRQLNVRSSTDGVTWPDQNKHTTSGFYLDTDPALVVYGSRLQAFVSEVQNGQSSLARADQFLIDNLAPGAGIPFAGVFDEIRTRNSVSAAVLGSELVLAWMSWDQNSWNTKKFNPSTGWGVVTIHSGSQDGHLFTASSWPPSVIWVERAHNVNIGPNQISLFRSFNGLDFSFLVTTPHTSEARPFGISATGSSATWSHVGTDSNHTLNLNSINF
jgi:hypothetical protein